MKRDLPLIQAAFEAVGHPLDETNRTNCPAHGGDNPKAISVHEQDGKWYVKCHTREDCTSEAIWRAVGLWAEPKPLPAGKLVYPATKDGKHVADHVVIRYEDGTKQAPWQWIEDVGVKNLDFYTPVPLNGRAEVVIVEGERTADAVIAAGYQAVGTYGSSWKPSPEALKALDGYEPILWPDADKVGIDHMRDIAKRLGRPVKMVDVSDLPEKVDAADLSAVVVRDRVKRAQPYVEKVLKRRPITDISLTPPPPLLIERLSPVGQSLLYGLGGARKGTTACYWIKQLVEGGMNILIIDYEGNPSEWRARLHGMGLSEALASERVDYIAPYLPEYWDGTSGPLNVIASDVREYADAANTDYVVLDSLMYATDTGKDPYSPDTAKKYGTGMQLIGRPSLGLAHISSDGNLKKPFGSAFWGNTARIAWSAEDVGKDTTRLQMQKHNNYAKSKPVLITYEYAKGMVTGNVTESYDDVSVEDDIKGQLTFLGALTVSELEDKTGHKAEAIRKSLNRSHLFVRTGAKVGKEPKWALMVGQP